MQRGTTGAALSALPQVQSRNPVAVNALFSELLRKNPQYANIAICDKSGLVWASALPEGERVSVADRRFVREAFRTGMFSSGEYIVGRILKKPAISFGYPVKDVANEVTAVIGIVLNLEYAQGMFDKLDLPSGASYALLDHQGVILTRNINDPLTKGLVGQRDTVKELFTGMKAPPEETTFQAMGNEGKFKLGAYRRIRLPHEAEPYMYVRASIPLSSAVAAANAAMFRNLATFVSLFLTGLFLAWFIGKRVIVNPLMMLKGAAGQLAAGADTVNVASVVTGGELGELARAFDDMAETLIQEKTALRTSEERWSTTLASIGDQSLQPMLKERSHS